MTDINHSAVDRWRQADKPPPPEVFQLDLWRIDGRELTPEERKLIGSITPDDLHAVAAIERAYAVGPHPHAGDRRIHGAASAVHGRGRTGQPRRPML